jgi:hypothetical protein
LGNKPVGRTIIHHDDWICFGHIHEGRPSFPKSEGDVSAIPFEFSLESSGMTVK